MVFFRKKQAPVVVSYVDEDNNEEVLRVVKQARRRGGLPGLPRKTLTNCTDDTDETGPEHILLFSSEGEIVTSYNVEAQSDCSPPVDPIKVGITKVSYRFSESDQEVAEELNIVDINYAGLAAHDGPITSRQPNNNTRTPMRIDTSLADDLEDLDSPSRHINESMRATPPNAHTFGPMCARGFACSRKPRKHSLFFENVLDHFIDEEDDRSEMITGRQWRRRSFQKSKHMKSLSTTPVKRNMPAASSKSVKSSCDNEIEKEVQEMSARLASLEFAFSDDSTCSTAIELNHSYDSEISAPYSIFNMDVTMDDSQESHEDDYSIDCDDDSDFDSVVDDMETLEFSVRI